LDLWDLCANGILDQDDIIDLRTREVQERYFADSVMAHAPGTLKYQRNNQEMVVKWKGELVDHMMAIDDHGKPTGLFVDQLVQNLDEVTGLFKGYSWKRYASGSQPRAAEHVHMDAAVASSLEASCVAFMDAAVASHHNSLGDSSVCIVYDCTRPGTHLDPLAPDFVLCSEHFQQTAAASAPTRTPNAIQATLPPRDMVDYFRQAVKKVATSLGVSDADKLIVTSCKNPGTPFGVIENRGDQMMSHYGAYIQREWHKKLVIRTSAELMEDTAADNSLWLHANIGLGPFLAELLLLSEVFDHGNIAVMSPEMSAGRFEAMMGIIGDAGEMVLFRGLMKLAYFIFILAHWHKYHNCYRTVDTLAAISLPASEACLSYDAPLIMECADPVWHEVIRSADVTHLENMHEDILKEMLAPTESPLDFATVGRAGRRVTSQFVSHEDFEQMMLKLHCIDCGIDVCTGYQDGSFGCQRVARQMGWSKATNKSWPRSSRCGACTRARNAWNAPSACPLGEAVTTPSARSHEAAPNLWEYMRLGELFMQPTAPMNCSDAFGSQPSCSTMAMISGMY
jgi:hypothetical protein